MPLEGRRSQTSSEEHNKTTTLPLFFELAIVNNHNEKIKRLPMIKDKEFQRKDFPGLKMGTNFFGIICMVVDLAKL